MEQRTLKLEDRVIYCYEDGSVEFLSSSVIHKSNPLVRTKGYDGSRGYKTIRISVNGKMKSLKVHRLVALAFHPNPEVLPEVDHINRDKSDNRPCNLRWADRMTNASNKNCVVRSIANYGVRYRDDRKAYNKVRRKTVLNMFRPDGKYTTTRTLSPEVYDVLKPLSMKDRYLKYQELTQTNKQQSIKE